MSERRLRPSDHSVLQLLGLLAILTLLLLVFSATIHAQLAGSATITDGDSLTVAGQHGRLFGIDTPESKQACVAGGQRWRSGCSATQALQTASPAGPSSAPSATASPPSASGCG